jgi:hypothetical protein
VRLDVGAVGRGRAHDAARTSQGVEHILPNAFLLPEGKAALIACRGAIPDRNARQLNLPRQETLTAGAGLI